MTLPLLIAIPFTALALCCAAAMLFVLCDCMKGWLARNRWRLQLCGRACCDEEPPRLYGGVGGLDLEMEDVVPFREEDLELPTGAVEALEALQDDEAREFWTSMLRLSDLSENRHVEL